MSLFHLHDSAEHGHSHGGWLERLDARVKLLGMVSGLVWVAAIPRGHEGALVLGALALLALASAARLSPAGLVVRASVTLPFVLVPILGQWLGGNLDRALLVSMALRGTVSAMVVSLTMGVTAFVDVIGALQALRVPSLVVQTTALVYRYLAVLRERSSAMMQSARARGFGSGVNGRRAMAAGMLGSLLVRSLQRSERVHASMLARGGEGAWPRRQPLELQRSDVIAAVVWTGLLSVSFWWNR